VAPEPETGLALGCDVSNYTSVRGFAPISSADLVRRAREEAGIRFIIVQALPTSYPSTDRQCQAVIDGGSVLGAYAWLFPGGAYDGDFLRRLQRLEPYREHLWRLATDVEDQALTEAEVHEAFTLAKAWLPNSPCMCYTGKWYLDAMGWTQATFPEVDEWWLSDYDGDPNPDTANLPCAIKQYADEPPVDWITGVDMNVCYAALLST